MAEFGPVINFIIDTIVLYYSTGFARVKGATLLNATIVTISALALGHILGPVVAGLFLVSLEFFFLAGLLAIFIRLILIKFIYRIDLSKAFSIWVFSALISFGTLLLLSSL
ncbi:MAG: hypothetical protein NTZ73_02765 [Candidatus Diapherotrites archaeon]|nr:hypothetical protein [Candidatus Diapherotrites archaeon]